MTSEKTAKLSPIVESPAIYSDPPDPTEEFEAEIDTTVIEKPETKHPLCDYYDENDENDRSGSDDELLFKKPEENTSSTKTNWTKLLSVSKFMSIWQSVKSSKYKKLVTYKCFNCGEEFYDLEFLKKHIETTHRKKSDNSPKTVQPKPKSFSNSYGSSTSAEW